jgi:dTMP kinase
VAPTTGDLPGRGEHRGLLITFEGPEGSGKTTLINTIAAHLAEKGEDPMILREPGGTEIGERIRNILLDTASEGMCAETELLLMVASRAQLVREKIEIGLQAGMIILCDRFADASVAYQGYGRGLGEKQVHALNKVALGDLEPHLTFLCLLPPEEGQKRLNRETTDRLDRETAAFHQKVYEGYQAMAVSGVLRFKVIDAADTPESMFATALGHLKKLDHGLLKYL